MNIFLQNVKYLNLTLTDFSFYFKPDASITQVTVVNQSPTSLGVTWSSARTPDSYKVDYQLTNEDQCKGNTGVRTEAYTGSDTSFEISSLIPYSTYNVLVESIARTCEVSEMMKTGTTSETSKFLKQSVNFESD